jgi:hypothetical protein
MRLEPPPVGTQTQQSTGTPQPPKATKPGGAATAGLLVKELAEKREYCFREADPKAFFSCDTITQGDRKFGDVRRYTATTPLKTTIADSELPVMLLPNGYHQFASDKQFWVVLELNAASRARYGEFVAVSRTHFNNPTLQQRYLAIGTPVAISRADIRAAALEKAVQTTVRSSRSLDNRIRMRMRTIQRQHAGTIQSVRVSMTGDKVTLHVVFKGQPDRALKNLMQREAGKIMVSRGMNFGKVVIRAVVLEALDR